MKFPFVFEIIKDDFASSMFAYLSDTIDLFDYCKKKSIALSEPKNKATKKYDRFVITVTTQKQYDLLIKKFPKIKELLTLRLSR